MKNYILNIMILVLFSGCEVSVDTEKPFSFIIKDKEPVEVYKKGFVYCKLNETKPYSGKGFYNDILDYKEYYTFKNGHKDGSYHISKNNRIVEEGNFVNNKLNGNIYRYPTKYQDFKIEKLIYTNDILQRRIVLDANDKILVDLQYKNNEPYNGFEFFSNPNPDGKTIYNIVVTENGVQSLKSITFKEYSDRKKLDNINDF